MASIDSVPGRSPRYDLPAGVDGAAAAGLPALAERITRAGEEADGPEEVAGALFNAMAEILTCDSGGMLLAGGGGDDLVAVGSPVPGASAPDRTMVEWAFGERRPVVLPAEGNTAAHVLLFPVLLRRRRTGCVYVRTPGAPPADGLLAAAALLARIAVLAAEGVQLRRELVRRERQVVLAEAQLDRAARLAAVGEIAAGVLHEIKNPLQILMMHLDMFDRGHALPNWRELFRVQVRRLSDIVRRLMQFSRMAAGDREGGWGVVDLNRAVRETAAIVAHEFRSGDIDIREDLSENLPAVAGEEGAVQHVLLGLLVNARDAMPEGGTIAVRSWADGGGVNVEVTDTGRGIAPDLVPRIFEPLVSGDGGGRGTGLGLYLARRIMERHRGGIRVSSAPGKGSTFVLTFPAVGSP